MQEIKYLLIKCADGKKWKVDKNLSNKCHCYLALEAYKDKEDFWHNGFHWFFTENGKTVKMTITAARNGKVPKYDKREHLLMITMYQ